MKTIIQVTIGLSLLLAIESQSAIHRWGEEFSPFGRLPGHQQNPDVALGARGGFAVWQHSSRTTQGERIVIHRINELMEGAGSPIRLTGDTARTQETHPRVAMIPNGGAVVVWESGGRNDRNIWIRFFNAAGQPATVAQEVNAYKRGNQVQPDVAVNRHGEVFVAWESERQDGDGKGIFAQRFTPQGLRVGAEIPVNQSIKMDQSQPACAALADGRCVVAWVGEAAHGLNQAGTPYLRGHVMGRLLDRQGNGIGNEFRLDGGQALCVNPRLMAKSDGGFVAAWSQRDEVSVVNMWDVHTRTFNRDGLPLQKATRQNKYTKDVQKKVTLAGLGTDVLLAWDCATVDGASSEVHGRMLSGGAEFRINTKLAFQQRMAAAAGDGQGRAMALWVDVMSAGNTTLRAQKFTSEGASADLSTGPEMTQGPVGRMRSALVMKVDEKLSRPGPQLEQKRESAKQEAIVRHENIVQEASRVARQAAAKSASRALLNTAQRTSMASRGMGSITKPNVTTAAVAEKRDAKVTRVRLTPRLSMRSAANPAAVTVKRAQTTLAARSAARTAAPTRTSMAAHSTLQRHARNYSAVRSVTSTSRYLANSRMSARSRAQFAAASSTVRSPVLRSTASNQAAQRAMQQYASRRMNAASTTRRFSMRPMPGVRPTGTASGRVGVRRPVSPGASLAQRRAEAIRQSALARAQQASQLRQVPVPATLDQAGGRLSLRFNTEAGRRYVVQTSADRNNWRNSGPVHRGTGQSMALPVNSRGGQKYIRVVPTD